MEKYFKVKTKNIDYDVTAEDLEYDRFDHDIDDMDDAEIDKHIAEVKASIPQEFILEIECEPEDLTDLVCDAISEESGWLVNSFDFDILEEKEIED